MSAMTFDTERKRAEPASPNLLTAILQILNRGGDLHTLIADTLRTIRDSTGFDAVGLRLRQGEDFPYFEQNGFSEEFLRQENFLCSRAEDGAILRDADGRAVLECTCGLVLSGRTDPSMPYFTEGGSFWTNASSELLSLSPENDPRNKPRNHCIHSGYESVGLFPATAGSAIIGLLQFNDRRSGRFTSERIAFYEGLAQNIGLALQRTAAEKAIEQSERRFRVLTKKTGESITLLDATGKITYNIAGSNSSLGYTSEEMVGRDAFDLVHPDDRPRLIKLFQEALPHPGRVEHVEVRIRAKNGSWRWQLAIGTNLLDDPAVGGIVINSRDITERKQAEEELQKNQARLEAVFAAIPHGILEYDTDLRLVRANAAALETAGLTSSGLNRDQVVARLKVSDLEGNLLRTENLPTSRALRGERVSGGLYSITNAAGVRRIVSIYSAPLYKDGEKMGVVALWHDVTEGKRAEEALRHSERRYRSFIEVTSQFAWVTDASGQVVEDIPALRKFTGQTYEQAKGEGWAAALHPEDRQHTLQVWNRAVATRTPYEIEYRMRRDDGVYRLLLVRGVPIVDHQGHVLEWVGTCIDITERKAAEKALRESEELFRRFFDNAPLGKTLTTPDGALERANPALCQMLGYSQEELAKLSFIDITHADDVAVSKECVSALLAGERDTWEMQKRFLSKDGRFVWTHVVTTLLRDSQGQPLRFLTHILDITERKQAEEALRQLNENLEQRVAERTELAEARARQLQALAMELIEAEEMERRRIAELLHDDLQQSLAAARLQLQGTGKDPPNTAMLANVEQILSDTLKKARRLSHELSPAVLHHSGLVASLEWLTGQMKEQFGLHVQLEADEAQQFESAPLKVFLFRAAQELLFNVVKHSGAKTARIGLSRSASGLVLEVIDQGQGFDPGILDSITSLGGFGLLSLRERANYIGGSFVIDSAPGKGSRFTLKVPISLANADAMAPAMDRQPPILEHPLVSTRASDIRVLFVDDHHVMRQGLIRLMYSQPVIQVVGEAANGREAIEQVRQLRPDVVVMDVSMPEMDGIEATRRIKAEWPEVRVIGLSMYDDEQISKRMRAAGAEAFMTKTASPGELLKAIYGPARHEEATV